MDINTKQRAIIENRYANVTSPEKIAVERKGYELVAALNYNTFFVLKQDYSLFDFPDNGIDAMHNCTNFRTIIFQGYEGTLFLAGCAELLWNGLPISQEDTQVLPITMCRYFEPLDDQPGGYAPAWIQEAEGKP